ncbi:hypothetical protein F383_05664 [Gossypium arboreum]|uniref:Uncharacterized protein n=1 Tax=Gossypium arboreum TaxID=29729 RepID=A0A0B0PRV7_GOSAR|nr:hypothetical protein F383_05664 [Gossypium arboreum]
MCLYCKGVGLIV